jgi:hypothetical protein
MASTRTPEEQEALNDSLLNAAGSSDVLRAKFSALHYEASHG